MESSFPTLRYFFRFFHLVHILFKGLFQPLCWLVNCMSWVFELRNIFWRMSRNLSIYLRPFCIAIYGKFCLYCLYLFRLFCGLYIVQIWSINYALHFGSVRRHKHCLYCNIFSTNIYRKLIFNYLLLFKVFLLVSKLY